jgi:F-type H+-transporting ATPase subunit epsilon
VAADIRLEVATPSRHVLSEAVDEVVVPGADGYFGVWPGHAPLLALLGVGELSYRVGRQERHLAIAGGFAEVGADHVTILADTAERPAEIDSTRARAARTRAEGRLGGRPGSPGEETDFPRATTALQRAQARLQVAARAPGA